MLQYERFELPVRAEEGANMKNKIIASVLTILIVMTLLPAASAMSGDDKAIGNGSLVLDTDPTGGYTGDYVVIYNPSTSSYADYSTGNMSGLIETTVEPYDNAPVVDDDGLMIIDVDGIIAEENANRTEVVIPEEPVRDSYEVGDTHTFTISSYSPGPSSLSFECVAVGDHCYVWTPAQNNANYWPLDAIDPTYPAIAAAEFDSKYDAMVSSFGNHDNGSGDGRVNLMYYNIDDGFDPATSNSYVAGYFSSWDYSTNGVPMIHIDTYPCVYYVPVNGEPIYRLDNSFSVFCHEYQHLINYSVTGGMSTWLNECMSAAAEEICYPGSSIRPRIQSWINYYYSDNGDWHTPPLEFEYTPEYDLHNGYSMYDWNQSLDYVLPLYAQVSLFSQYLFTHYGNPIFRSITEQYNSTGSTIEAIANATGDSTSDIVKNFRIALTANDPVAYDGLYGFVQQEGYNPDEHNGVENLYSLLGPVVFTGSSCSIGGGGAITVKPVGGVYNPPSDANSQLVYIGVTRNIPVDPVSLEDMELNCSTLTMYTGHNAGLSIIRTPINANDYEIVWESSDTSVVEIAHSGKTSASLYGASVGTATVTCTATDNASGTIFTDSAVVTVNHYPTFAEAVNAEGGSLEFVNNGTYPWEVILDDSGRAAVKSSNEGQSNTTSSMSITLNMAAGDTLSFEWRVSSEANYDELKFYVNNTLYGSEISGDTNWTTITYTASASGAYTFRWDYTKDGSVNSNDDCGYVDNVEWVRSLEPGDVNGDGATNQIDALLVLRYSMGLIDLTAEQLGRADIDGNDLVNSTDALTILRMSMGI